ncbi:hypothetical protein EIN_097820 [Entamoeba invadens IP1]|uniref:Transmembrane protein n=1 Tax=Entamoeba invadens IP1 TaxID=370355 RepID=A0A0A1U0R7_ENTIV|nr:hypothetical protein EIN_097820 [Entamoeba invadens IP1]ELP87495.1 hypothetical protein EIN_097820 [Entamoeba invadens IP1]|eukprot:XP_004254266.1 hypothetical protein EIN_097820 [Entamoeba invadens IP1]
MDGSSEPPQQQQFNPGVGVTSTHIPVMLEAFLSSFFVLSSAIFFFVEKTNVYCRAVAMQSIIWFFILFIIALPFYMACIAFGGFGEVVMMVYVLLYIIFKIALILMAVIRAHSEVFLAVPPFGNIINKYAANLD